MSVGQKQLKLVSMEVIPQPVPDMDFNINMFPPEVLEQIFEKLQNPMDLVNVSNTCQYWQDIVSRIRSHYLFELTFPSILKHLSKPEVLQCRVVSKRWCKGVDYFLENNCFHRPAPENRSQQQSSNKTSNYSSNLPMTLQDKGLTYNRFWGVEKMQKMLAEAALHPRCPIIGKSASIVISVRTRLQLTTLTKFFEMFGHQLWFLNIVIVSRYPDPVEMLSLLLNLIAHCPNLKMLDINDENFHRVEQTLESDEKLEAKTSLTNFLKNKVTEEMRQRFPKVETLRVKMNQVCTLKFQEILLSLFCSDNKLQSLSLDPMVPLGSELPLKSLTHLNASLYSENVLSSIIPLRSQVQSLELQVCGPINTATVFETVSHFKSNLRNFGFSITPNLYKNFPSHDLSAVIRPLMNTEAFENFPHLQNVSLEGWLPSLNFVHGLRSTVDNIQISSRTPVGSHKMPPTFVTKADKEIIDLLETVKASPLPKQTEIYKLNVWNLFPRLQGLTVRSSQGKGSDEEEREYSREIFDKFQQ